MRFDDWPERLAKIIEKQRNQGFKWGDNDCCTFANTVYCTMTGRDIMAEFSGTYKTAAGAMRALKKHGFSSIREAVSHYCGDEISPRLAQRGDLVMVIRDGAESMGVCIGAYGAFVGIEKLEFLPMSEAVTAWRVS